MTVSCVVQKVDPDFVQFRRVKVPTSCVAGRAAERVVDRRQCGGVYLELQQSRGTAGSAA